MYNEKTGNYITPVGRASFPVLAEPKQINGEGEPKYQLTILFDPQAQETEDFKDLKRAVKKAIKEKWGDDAPRRVKNPFMTIDDLRNKVPAGYEEDTVFIRLASNIPVGVVALQENGKNRRLEGKEIIKELYAGCDVRASVNVYAWQHPVGGAGVSFGLANVQKVGENEPFGASNADAADDFGAEVTAGEADDDFAD